MDSVEFFDEGAIDEDGVVPPVIEPKKAARKIIPDMVPFVHLVFDKDEAQDWLHISSRRLKKVFFSVRFEPEGMPENLVPFLVRLAAESVSPKYKDANGSNPVKGFFYCPVEWAEEVPDSLEQTGTVGDYAVFQPRD